MTTHRYLLDEDLHHFSPSIAERLGLNEAIILRYIHGWFNTYRKKPDEYRAKHFHDGRWWVWNSYSDWHDDLPYFSESTIKRALTSLRKQGIVIVGNYNAMKIDRTNWYAIDYDAYDKLWSDHEVKMTPSPAQLDQTHQSELTQPIPMSSLGVPPEKDPPPADPSLDELWPTDRPPTQGTQPHSVEQVKAGVRRALEQNARNGNGRAGVADPTHESDPWADKPLKAFCVLVGEPFDELKPSKRKDWPQQLREWAEGWGTERPPTPYETFQCIQGITESELNWMTFTSPRQTSFQNVMDRMYSRLRNHQPWNMGGTENGGPSTPRDEVNAAGYRAVPKGSIR